MFFSGGGELLRQNGHRDGVSSCMGEENGEGGSALSRKRNASEDVEMSVDQPGE